MKTQNPKKTKRRMDSLNEQIVQKIREDETISNAAQAHYRKKMHADLRYWVVYRYMTTGQVGAEIGVDYGYFSDRVLEIAPPSKYYLIDPWSNKTKCNYIEIVDKYKKQIKNKQIEAIQKSGIAGANLIPNNSLDWVYIDCSHEKQDVIDNVHAYLPKVKSGGYFMGDDAHVLDVYNAFMDILEQNPDKLEFVFYDDIIVNQIIFRKK
tara:strand:- start:23229 stop:23852 length:624 start_codon:yes stop_codon:yes gene_type:complete